jgi:hypothetical protein
MDDLDDRLALQQRLLGAIHRTEPALAEQVSDHKVPERPPGDLVTHGPILRRGPRARLRLGPRDGNQLWAAETLGGPARGEVGELERGAPGTRAATVRGMRSLLFLAVIALTGCTVDEVDADFDVPMDDDPDPLELSRKLFLGGHPARADFTDPASFGAQDRTIVDEVIRLIDRAEAGSEIRAAIHSLGLPGVKKALLDAETEGVRVFVVSDGSKRSDEAKALHAELDPGHHKWCERNGGAGCISKHPGGIMHTKLFTFSRTTDKDGTPHDNVVWIGSANMTSQTGMETYNNAITVYGDQKLYGQMTTYFQHLMQPPELTNNDYFDRNKADRGFWMSPSTLVYASPEADGDLVAKQLNDIKPDASCRIRVAENMIHAGRSAVVDLLVKLRGANRDKCKIWVVVKGIDAQSLAKLHAARIPVKRTGEEYGVPGVHDKFVIANAKAGDSAENRFLVFTGSHNLTTSANSENDELFVRYESKTLYTAFHRHFGNAYAAGK